MLSTYLAESKEQFEAGRIAASHINSTECFLFLTHRWSPILTERVQKLRNTGRDVWVVYDMRSESRSATELTQLFRSPVFPVSLPERIPAWLRSYDFRFSHLMILAFFESSPHYERYWCWENDVEMNGRIDLIMKWADSVEADLIADLRDPGPLWDWLTNRCHVLLEGFQRQAFQPVARFSNRLLRCITKSLGPKHYAYFELYDPLLCHRNEWPIETFPSQYLGSPYDPLKKKIDRTDLPELDDRFYHPVHY